MGKKFKFSLLLTVNILLIHYKKTPDVEGNNRCLLQQLIVTGGGIYGYHWALNGSVVYELHTVKRNGQTTPMNGTITNGRRVSIMEFSFRTLGRRQAVPVCSLLAISFYKNLKTGHHRFLPYPFQFIIHISSTNLSSRSPTHTAENHNRRNKTRDTNL